MRILVYGAGGLGSLLAARLLESGQEVSLLARGQRLVNLRENGLVLEDLVTHLRRTYAVRVVDSLAPEDVYDWVIIVMGKQHLPEILPTLAANHHIRNYLFMGNNVAGAAALTEAVGRERVLLGFFMAVGKVEGSVAFAANQVDGAISPSVIGELDGAVSQRLIEIAAVFENAHLPVQFCNDIQAWLKCHAAIIVPLGGAYFLADRNLLRISRTRDIQIILVRGVREALQVLRFYRTPILPSSLKMFLWLPEPLVLLLIGRALENPNLAYALIHADGIRPEINQLGKEFCFLARGAGLMAPHFDRLLLATAPQSRPLPEGSHSLPVDWRSTFAVIGALATVVGLIFGISLLRSRRPD